MEGYLRGYYGYKNFGDELLFFGVVKRLSAKYPLTKLFVEVGDVSRMEDRLWENYQENLTEQQLKIIRFVDAKQHRYKRINHMITFLGGGKYKKVFKFFGGGEVLSDERGFPHDGRNIPLLFNHSVRNKKFVLLGGIGKVRKSWTATLYNYLLPKAEMIVVRDRDSYAIATQERGDRDERQETRNKEFGQKELYNNVILYQDFAQETILNAEGKMQNLEGKAKGKYILVNINKQSLDAENIKKITEFCQRYPEHKKIFFPCDMNDDAFCFSPLQKHVSGLEMYDRSKHTLAQSLSLFYDADAGIGARLHFLLPLKLYQKTLVAIPYADKIHKMIIKK